MTTVVPDPDWKEEKIKKNISAQKEDPAKIEERYLIGGAV